MKVVVQRSKQAAVTADGQLIGPIEKGLMLLVGITHEDTEKDVAGWRIKWRGYAFLKMRPAK